MNSLQQKNPQTGRFRFFRVAESMSQGSGKLDDTVRKISSAFKFTGRKLKYFYLVTIRKSNTLIEKSSMALGHFTDKVIQLHDYSCSFGVTVDMEVAPRRKLTLLNQINILHFSTCMSIPFMALFRIKGISFTSLLLSLAPAFVSALVLLLNYLRRYNSALLCYFILYPFFTCLIYLDGMNLGMELYFMIYGILAIFFLKEISHMLFSIGFSMVSY